MRFGLLTSRLCGFLLLGSSIAQTVSSTSAAVTETGLPADPTETDTGTSTPVATPTDDPEPSSSDTTTGTDTNPTDGTPTSSGSSATGTSPPDVYLSVPELHVGRIELDVDDLNVELTLAARVAALVELNAGVQVSVTKVNITIADVDAELELIIRLGNLVDIVNRTLESLNLNPLLINVLNEVTDLVDTVVGAVDGLLGSILNGDSKINFIIDNLGNIVQEVEGTAGNLLSSIVGNFEQNMTYTGEQKILDGGLIQKTYMYSPLNSLVNIVFNNLDQVVQAVVVKRDGGGGSGGTTTSSAPTSSSTSTAATARR